MKINLNLFADIFKGFFFNPKENSLKIFPTLISTENDLVVYKILAPGLFYEFFSCLVGDWKQKVLFSTKDEVKDFCENKLPDWLKSEDITNLCLCKIDPDKEVTEKNTQVVVVDLRENDFIIRYIPLNNDVVWGYDVEHLTFILIP